MFAVGGRVERGQSRAHLEVVKTVASFASGDSGVETFRQCFILIAEMMSAAVDVHLYLSAPFFQRYRQFMLLFRLERRAQKRGQMPLGFAAFKCIVPYVDALCLGFRFSIPLSDYFDDNYIVSTVRAVPQCLVRLSL